MTRVTDVLQAWRNNHPGPAYGNVPWLEAHKPLLAISVVPNRANATSGSSPDNEVDFSVMADYTSGRSAPWNGDVQWSVDAGWVNLQSGRAICTGPAPPLFPLNIPTPAGITARITTSEGKTLTAPALLACF